MIIEIDLAKLERGLREGRVKVTRSGKTFWRKQRIGQKEIEKPTKQITTEKPNYEIMKVIQQVNHVMSLGGKGSDWGFVDFDKDAGTFTWQNSGDYDPVDFRVEGNTIIRVDDNSQIIIPERDLRDTSYKLLTKYPKWIADLDDDWGSGWGAHNPEFKRHFDEFKADESKYVDRLKKLNTFIPEYKKITGEPKGKYADSMELQTCTNSMGVTNSGVPSLWYGGNADNTALVGEAVNEVVSGRYNKDNVVQQQIPMLIEGSKKVNKDHGTDVIYRGETNVSAAESLLYLINRAGSADLDDKLFSCTENEKLGKWYSSVHNQESARGVASKTHVMLKISREKFEDNVIMDYRVMGETVTPEQEVTIVGNGITLTGDDVMVNANTPKRKTKKWMTFTQFKSEGGEVENLINQMVGER